MKTFAETILSEEASKDSFFHEPPPTQEQLRTFVKQWRKNNRDDSVRRVIEFCSQAMSNRSDRNVTERLVFCEVNDDNGLIVPDIRIGSDSDLMRVGLTWYGLLEAHLNVQTDPRCATTRPADIFPSQRKTDDIKWILAFLKRVFQERYAVRFSPQYVATDAGYGQCNTSNTELPTTAILMCWLHSEHKNKNQSLLRVTREMAFRDFDRLYFCESYIVENDRILVG
ncbi:LOW QUALITY PROTEIN: hypothetical protein PHPALM_27834 [Phytophthora palmivora]|uniref:Uncharacterized protein n=1 Tax=Phytophthora palmivora TaxID=4796 RepID=A0A2P4XBL4_9STRA|nr:LOW QUALITY PROTEIN: hypothetical protein PHPALM_27834 [Phytophthora palmivora]